MSALDLTADSATITRAICDIESESGSEQALADAIETALTPFTHLELTRDGDAIVARTQLSRAQRVVIAGHIDTVPVNNNLPTRVVDGHIWGRGTVDMKAGVAVQLKLAAELVAPAYDLAWIWYDHEEVSAELNGLGRLAARRPELLAADFAILGEPSNAVIEGGCNGTVRAELVATGVRAHSARAWMGSNAIHGLEPALERLANYQPATVNVDGLDYREGLNAVRVSGGVAGNVIPDRAVIEVNYRFAPSRSADAAIAELRALFPEYELIVTDQADGARPGLDAPIARAFAEAVGSEPQPKYGWTDVARFSALGIPAVNFGPGDPSLAHADDERVPLDQIVRTEDALRAWLS